MNTGVAAVVEALDDEIEKPPASEPHFQQPSSTIPTRVEDHTERSDGEALVEGGTGTHQATVSKPTRGRPRKSFKEEFHFPVKPRVVNVVKKPRTVVNHSYRDFSCVPPELTDEAPKADEMTFSQKLHEILSTKEYEPYISWMPHGRSFRVHVPKRFESKVSPKYFGHSRYSSFLRQLNNYGLKHITKGPDRNCFYHECFLRGLPHLCKYMPKPKNARRLVPDPENEPNFYQISESFPLPDESSSAQASVETEQQKNSKPPATTEMQEDRRPMGSAIAGPAVAGPAVEPSRPETSHLRQILGLNQNLLPSAHGRAGAIRALDQSASAYLSQVPSSSLTALASLQALQNRSAAQSSAIHSNAVIAAAAAARLRRLSPTSLSSLNSASTRTQSPGTLGVNYVPRNKNGSNRFGHY